jgi:hypothetical protein
MNHKTVELVYRKTEKKNHSNKTTTVRAQPLTPTEPHSGAQNSPGAADASPPLALPTRVVGWNKFWARKQNTRSSKVRPRSQEHLRCLPAAAFRVLSPLPPAQRRVLSLPVSLPGGGGPPPSPSSCRSCPFSFVEQQQQQRWHCGATPASIAKPFPPLPLLPCFTDLASLSKSMQISASRVGVARAKSLWTNGRSE